MGRFRRGSKTAWQIAECHFDIQFILRLDAISKAEIGNRRQPCRLIHYPRVTACGWLAGVSTAAQGLMAFCVAKRDPWMNHFCDAIPLWLFCDKKGLSDCESTKLLFMVEFELFTTYVCWGIFFFGLCRIFMTVLFTYRDSLLQAIKLMGPKGL